MAREPNGRTARLIAHRVLDMLIFVWAMAAALAVKGCVDEMEAAYELRSVEVSP